jgi:hypothetical protein
VTDGQTPPTKATRSVTCSKSKGKVRCST